MVVSSGNQLHENGEAVPVHEEQVALLVVRSAAPIHTAHIAGKNERPLKTRRSENLSGSRGFDFVGHHCRSSGFTPQASSGVRFSGTTEMVEAGCVGQDSPPRMSLLRTG